MSKNKNHYYTVSLIDFFWFSGGEGRGGGGDKSKKVSKEVTN